LVTERAVSLSARRPFSFAVARSPADEMAADLLDLQQLDGIFFAADSRALSA
jgi:hypothetical protein